MRRQDQVRLFEAALDDAQLHADMVNRALDVTFDLEHDVVATIYDLP